MDDDLAESSNCENPQFEYSFFLEMKPLSKLKSMFETLIDQQFSDSSVGLLDADTEGFTIYVQNSRNAFAHLQLQSCESIKFLSFKPVIGKYVVMDEICDRFPADLNDHHNIIRVYHVLGSDRLWFEFVTTPPTRFSTKFVTVDAPIGRWLRVRHKCTTVIPTKTLTDMIESTSSVQLVRAEDPCTRKFSAHLRINFVRFGLKNKKTWLRMYKTKGLTAAQSFSTELNLTYISFLKKASSLSRLVAVSFLEGQKEGLKEAKEHVMFWFKVANDCRLVILKETLSVENPDTNYSFYLEMKPLHKLRLAIEALADADFNGDGSETTFGISKCGFGFVVQNTRHASARLWLYSSSLVRFQCCGPLVVKIGALGSIYSRFPTHPQGFRDTVCIFHVQGTTQLCFKIGTTPVTEFSVEFTIYPNIRSWFPAVEVIFGTCLPTKDMKQMIDSMLQADDPSTEKVLVAKMGNYATFLTGEERYWDYEYSKDGLGGMIEVQPGEVNQEWFNWSYTALLKKASFLDLEVAVYFLSFPEDHVMFRFSIEEFGFLSIVKKAISHGP